MKTLVVYYSRSGKTREIAERISSKLQADLAEIKDCKNRKGIMGFIGSGNEAYQRKAPPIDKIEKDPARYECIIIGTPIWASHMSTPVQSFLKEYKDTFKNVAFFCTSMGSDTKPVFWVMEQMTGQKPVAVMNVTARDMKKQYHNEIVDEYIREIKSSDGMIKR